MLEALTGLKRRLAASPAFITSTEPGSVRTSPRAMSCLTDLCQRSLDTDRRNGVSAYSIFRGLPRRPHFTVH